MIKYRYYFDYRLVEYNTDRGLVLEDVETKYYYQKFSEDKDFNIEMKGPLPTSFSELTITTFSKTYDSYSRSYKKGPELLAEIGGVINSMYIIALVLNFYSEKKLKEAEIFNMCCVNDKNQREKSEDKNSELQQNNFDNIDIKRICIQKKFSVTIGSPEKGSSRSMIRNNYFSNDDSEKGSSNDVVRFKSIIFDKMASLDLLIKVNYNYCDILCPFRINPIQKEKMELAEKFCDQLFDINFLFSNVLDAQINFKNIFENNKG